MTKNKKKLTNLVCTGLTEKEFNKQVKTFGLDKIPEKRKCYLCKRPEGEKSVVLSDEEKYPIYKFPIELSGVNYHEEGEDEIINADFLICQECAMLLDGFIDSHNKKVK